MPSGSFRKLASEHGLMVALGLGYRHAQQQKTIARLQEISNSDHGSTIDEVTKNVVTNMPASETIFVFNKDGDKLIEYASGSPHAVSLPEEALRLLAHFRNLTHIHNHPNFDSGHSDNDLSMPVRVGLDKSITTLGVIGPEHVFYMHRGKQSWPTRETVFRYFFTLMSAHNPAIDPVWMGTTTVDGVKGGYFTNACLRRFAEDFGYTFEIVDPFTS